MEGASPYRVFVNTIAATCRGWQWAPIAVLVLGVAGAAIGAGILNADRPFPDSAKAFTSGGADDLWMFLIAAQTALWAVAVLPLTDSLRAVWRFRPTRLGPTVVSTIAFVVVLVLFVAGSGMFKRYYTFPAHEEKLTALTAIGSAVVIATVFGMLLVHAGLIRLGRETASGGADERAIADFALLREHLQRLLAIMGAIIGAAILATAALRNAIVAFADRVMMEPGRFPHVFGHDGFPPVFPPEQVLIYGAVMSIVLGLFWAPIYILLIRVGTALRDATIEGRKDGESLPDWQERQARYGEFLGLQPTTIASFRAGVAILTPLASALLGLLFKT
jgi:hypothetical protein